MITHNDLWRAIDDMADYKHMSCSKMARSGGLDATTFNKSKRYGKYGKPRWMSIKSLVKVLNSFGAKMGDFANFVDNNKKK